MTAWRWLPVPALLLLAGGYLVPLGGVLWLSVTEPAPGLGNYALLATSPAIARVLGTTARISLITTAFTLLGGYAVSYVLVQARPAVQRLMLVGVLLPLWVSVLARTFAWVALLRREGVVNTWLQAAGITDGPLPLMWNEFGVTVAMVHAMLPFAILPMAAHMRSLDPALVAAARGMGAGVLVGILSAGFYVTPVLLGGGRVRMVAEYIALQIQELLRWGVGTMLATALLLAVAALLGLSRVLGLHAVAAR